MIESSASQIVVGTTESFFPDRGFSLKKVGRKPKITEEKYLDAVRRTKCIKDSHIASYLGLHRTTVFNFRKKEKNKEIINKAEVILNDINNVNFDSRFVSVDKFRELPTILNWIDMQKIRRVSADSIKDRVRVLFNVCRRLKTHPDNLSVEQCAKLVIDMRVKMENGEKAPRGLSYYNIRKPLRSFFQLIRRLSGEYLTGMGIDAGRSKGTGSAASERVTREQRKRFETELWEVIKEYSRDKKMNGIDPDLFYTEMLGLTQFMYYTATRIGHRKDRGCLSIRLNNPKHKLSKEGFWYINVIDKGKNGGLEWNKPLIDDGKEKLKEYLSKRFGIPIDELETELQNVDSFMFPIIKEYYILECEVMKETLRRCGNITDYPNHIWRHTFAQDALHATDWNYELVASIGGWADTGTMKLSYGKMSEQAKQRGLMRMMNLDIPDVTYELRW